MGLPLFSLVFGHILIGFAGILGIMIAGTRLKNVYEIIQRQAAFDALTGIPNRRSFSRSMEVEYGRSKRNNEPLAIIMCDVDNFKAYNDTYGHSSGDQCLKKIAQTIKTFLERPGDFCARYGGEEFIILLSNTSLDGAIHIAKRIRLNIMKMGIPHEKSLPAQVVTLSCGVTTSESDV